MSGSIASELARRLEELREAQLLRRLRTVDSPASGRIEIEGRVRLNFSSNDYLGLANHPRLKEAACQAVEKYGAGAGASRLISGSTRAHLELEEAIAAFKGAEAALVFSSGYAAALGAIPSLVGAGDAVIIDKLVHACVVDAARLSGAKLRVFAHNDLNELAEILQWFARQRAARPGMRALIVVESLYSMDGDFAPLREIAALKEKHEAWLMVDEAHATGLFGANRRGLIEQMGVSGRVEVQMGTLGKAVGASGGCITGARALIDFLVNRARPLIFSTAPPPAASAAAQAGIELIQSSEGAARLEKLRANLRLASEKLRMPLAAPDSPILPVRLGEEARALAAAQQLWDEGIYAPAIRYPTVAKGEARLRLSFSAAHEPGDIEALSQALLRASQG